MNDRVIHTGQVDAVGGSGMLDDSLERPNDIVRDLQSAEVGGNDVDDRGSIRAELGSSDFANPALTPGK